MTNKQTTLIEGDLELIAAEDPSIYGNGDLTIAGNLAVTGTFTASLNFKSTRITYELSTGTNCGSFLADTWTVRNFNTIVTEANSGVTLVSNQIILQAGTYLINVSAPGYKCNSHQIRLYNVTDSTVDSVGTTEYAGSTNTSRSFCFKQIKLTSSKTYEIQHRCTAQQLTNGLGIAGGISTEIYSQIFILTA